MTSFSVDVDELISVAGAVLGGDGVLLAANAAFFGLLPPDGPRVGERVARYFIQPTFAELAIRADDTGPKGYRGPLTLGDPAGTARTLNGRVRRTELGIQVVAEFDVAEIERINAAMLALNGDCSLARHALASANIGLKRSETRMAEQSLTDALTGVGNRRMLEQALKTEVEGAKRHRRVLSAVMSDIDRFKQVNDEHGHGAGDKVLARFGALLKSQCRSSDVVSRFGGEEFVVLMPGVSLAQAAMRAEQFRCALEADVVAPLRTPVTASFGVAELSLDEDGESLMRRLDEALYQAKNSGRNRVVSAGPPLVVDPA